MTQRTQGEMVLERLRAVAEPQTRHEIFAALGDEYPGTVGSLSAVLCALNDNGKIEKVSDERPLRWRPKSYGPSPKLPVAPTPRAPATDLASKLLAALWDSDGTLTELQDRIHEPGATILSTLQTLGAMGKVKCKRGDHGMVWSLREAIESGSKTPPPAELLEQLSKKGREELRHDHDERSVPPMTQAPVGLDAFNAASKEPDCVEIIGRLPTRGDAVAAGVPGLPPPKQQPRAQRPPPIVVRAAVYVPELRVTATVDRQVAIESRDPNDPKQTECVFVPFADVPALIKALQQVIA